MKQEYAIFFQNGKLIIGRHGNFYGLHLSCIQTEGQCLMITLTLLDANFDASANADTQCD